MQSTNGARSAVITRENIEDIALKGRDFAGMLKLLPGVIDTRNREAPGWENMNNLSINGRTSFNFSYDGVTNKDTGQNGGNFAAPALDSIAEIRVQTSNFQAEYGRSSGATISVVTRSGTKDFHGSAAFYKRDDSWNGNEYQRRILCDQGQTAKCAPPLYTFDNTAWTLGGPVLLPKTGFNRNRNKLFFFWSQDILGRTDPGTLNQRRVPTALERRGDFSQTFDNQGRLIFIRDPLLAGNCAATSGGPACFANNVIPGRPDRSECAGAAESVSAAERDRSDGRESVQLRLPDRAGLAAQRSGASCRLEHRAEHDGLRTAAVRLREAVRRRLAPRLQRRLAADGDEVRDRHGQLREHAAAHVQPDVARRVHGRRELGAPVHQPVRRRRA